MKSYDYQKRKGIRQVSWDDFDVMCRQLAEQIDRLEVDIIIGIARAGLYPAVQLAGMLRKEILPVRITRRVNNIVKYKTPRWIVDVPDAVKHKSILIVDEISDSGETLRLVTEKVIRKNAGQVMTVTLVTHTWSKPKPNLYALESDELVLFPWDNEILTEGRWIPNPEIAEALKLQKRS